MSAHAFSCPGSIFSLKTRDVKTYDLELAYEQILGTRMIHMVNLVPRVLCFVASPLTKKPEHSGLEIDMVSKEAPFFRWGTETNEFCWGKRISGAARTQDLRGMGAGGT